MTPTEKTDKVNFSNLSFNDFGRGEDFADNYALFEKIFNNT